MNPDDFLKTILENGRIPHALLFCGGDLKALEEKAYSFASAVMLKNSHSHKHKLETKTHPDIHLYHPRGKLGMHSIEQLKHIAKESALYPHESNMKFFIIHEADRSLPTSSNALLKTLEEPISHSIFILTTAKKSKMLPTICSRCQTLNFPLAPTLHPLVERFSGLLSHATSLKEIEAFAFELEKEKKDLEKEMLKTIPKELTPQAREQFEEEIAGELAMKYQSDTTALLETIYLLACDQSLAKLGVKDTKLGIGSKPLPKIDIVESQLKRTRIALDRGISLPSALTALCLQLKIL